MVAPKTETGKYDLTVKDEIAKEEEDISAYEEDDKPLTFDDFKKRFQIKHSMFSKKDNVGNGSGTGSNNGVNKPL